MNKLSKWALAAIAAILALSISIPEASADKLSDLENKKQQVEQKQGELNSGIQQKANEISQNDSKLE